MSPLISIIMPAYNSAAFIAESIQSVRSQTWQEWELIIVDDGSTDETAKVVKEFAAADRRIKYIYQTNQRQAHARNTGIRHASGDLIAFLDNDDLWLPRKLELQWQVIDETRADLVFSNGFVFLDDDTTNESQDFPIVTGHYTGQEMLDLKVIRNRIPVLTVLVRRELLMAAGGFDVDERYWGSDDYELWCRLAHGGATFFGMKERLARYRVHGAAMTIRQSSRLELSQYNIAVKYAPLSRLDARTQRERLTQAYRRIIGALLAEGNQAEALARLPELRRLDSWGWKSVGLRLIARRAPRHYTRLQNINRRLRGVLRFDGASVRDASSREARES